jgi:FkbM family methyltransferase
MWVDPRRAGGLETAIYHDGTYEAGTLDVSLRSLRPGDTFLDVGANIGLMSLAAGRAVGASGRVLAFEPVPGIYALLQQNVALNQSRNISALQLALGSCEEQRLIYDHEEINRGSASLVKPDDSRDGEVVPVTTLDAFMAEHHLKSLRMVKIDVEGWELEVLRGGRGELSSHQAPILCIEYSDRHRIANGELLDIYRFVQSVNEYRIYRLPKGKDHPSKLRQIPPGSPRHDNILLPPSPDRLDPTMFELTRHPGS